MSLWLRVEWNHCSGPFSLYKATVHCKKSEFPEETIFKPRAEVRHSKQSADNALKYSAMEVDPVQLECVSKKIFHSRMLRTW